MDVLRATSLIIGILFIFGVVGGIAEIIFSEIKIYQARLDGRIGDKLDIEEKLADLKPRIYTAGLITAIAIFAIHEMMTPMMTPVLQVFR
jgi:hypothetical protein